MSGASVVGRPVLQVTWSPVTWHARALAAMAAAIAPLGADLRWTPGRRPVMSHSGRQLHRRVFSRCGRCQDSYTWLQSWLQLERNRARSGSSATIRWMPKDRPGTASHSGPTAATPPARTAGWPPGRRPARPAWRSSPSSVSGVSPGRCAIIRLLRSPSDTLRGRVGYWFENALTACEVYSRSDGDTGAGEIAWRIDARHTPSSLPRADSDAAGGGRVD